ncbi:MAG: RsmE family RNA methyltransferase [Planctomycetota bacterium]
MSRRYFVPSLPALGRFTLPDAVARHLAVMRVRVGDPLILFDGQDREAEVQVIRVDRRTTEVEIRALRNAVRVARVAIELAVALPRGNRAEWLFEHATEVGVARIRPIATGRSRSAGSEGRRARWERIVIAACEQCDRSRLPAVDDEIGLDELLSDPQLPPRRVVALPDAGIELGRAAEPTLLCIGPEGGFAPDEVAALLATGFTAVSLGALTLRTETAALVGLARLLA